MNINPARASESKKETPRGLSNAEVLAREEQNLTNKHKIEVGKSYLEIIFTDLFSFFNILLFIIAGLMIYAQYYDGLFFLVVLIPNIIVTMYEDIHARYLLGKLKMVTQPLVKVVRNGFEQQIKSDNVCLDDVLHYQGSAQICTDAQVLVGELLVNESLLTGESKPIKKVVGDKILAGSYTISGDAYVQTTAVGENCYIETIHKKAKQFKRTQSEIKSSMKFLFLGIGIIVISVAIAMCIIYALQGKFNSVELVKNAIRTSISGSMVAMIPSGMYLLTSAVFSLSVIKLGEKNAQIQDFYSVEMLSKINTLCVDKTGTITDGKLQIKKVISLNSQYNEKNIGDILYTIVKTTGDNNETAHSIIEKFYDNQIIVTKTSLAFNSENKYSAITLGNNETFVFGAYECSQITRSIGTERKINEFIENGYRVLALGHNYLPIKKDKIDGSFEIIALIVIEDHIKDDAKETFAWFKENNVKIKVISGDNAKFVSIIAKDVGIEDAENYISLEGMTVEQVRKIAHKYTVFGRVTPEQKEAIVMSLRNKRNKVAMTGDGVNDILALKRSDCSIAMANGSEAARNVSNIVLLDSNFRSLPSVVSEGRKIVCNLQRTCSLFLVKTMFAMFFSIMFLAWSVAANDPSIAYPFKANNLYLWEIFGIGLSAFFLALEKNESKYKGHFMKNILQNAVPAGVIVIIGTLALIVCGQIQFAGKGYFGVIDNDTVVAMCSICFSLLSLVILYQICKPLNLYRGIVFGGACFLEFGIGLLAYLLTMKDGNCDNSILRIPFEKMTPTSWFTTLIVFLVCSSIYIFVIYIIKVLKGEIQDVENKSRN